MPIGPARLAEPSPGVDVNVAVLGIGLAVAALLPVLLVIPAAWRATADLSGSMPSDTKLHRPSYLATRLRSVGVPTSSAIGVQMAFESGRGRTAVPVQSTLIGSVIAVTAVTAALVFGANLNHLVTTPAQYGQNWQQEIDLGFGSVRAPVLDSAVAHQPGMRAYAYGDYGQVTVGGRSVPAIAIHQRKGAGFVTLLSGRVPAGPDEIAVGARTLHSLGRHLGDTVSVVVPGATHRVHIVGEAVFPSFSVGSFTPTDLGSGALVSTSLLASQAAATCSGSPPCYTFALTRFGSAANRRRLGVARAGHRGRRLPCRRPQRVCGSASHRHRGLHPGAPHSDLAERSACALRPRHVHLRPRDFRATPWTGSGRA